MRAWQPSMTESAAAPEPFVFTAPLSVCVDVKHPQAYLALRPVQALAEELALDVDWLPFPAPGLKPPPPEPAPGEADDRGTRHRRHRARYLERNLARYAATAGLTLRDLYRATDSTCASVGLLWLRDRAPLGRFVFLERLFAAHWAGQIDVEDGEAIGTLLDDLGHDGAEFRRYLAEDGPMELDALRERLAAAGVFAVPSLVVEGEVFVGHAHLPMVQWLLSGKTTPRPI